MNINYIKSVNPLKGMLPALLLGVASVLCLSSCKDDLFIPFDEDYDGQEIVVPLSLSVLPIQSVNPESRAIEYIEPTDDEKFIHDFWIIEYHENGTRAGLPRYYTLGTDTEPGTGLPNDIKIIVPRRDEDTYTCVLIANSNDPNLFNAKNRSKFSTINDLRKFEMSTHNHEHVFNPQEYKYLLMSGWTTIKKDPDTHALSFDLIRNVCKVHVQLTAFPESRLAYKYFQWRDVPLGKAFPHGAVEYTQSEDRDWREHHDNDTTQFKLTRKDLEDGLDFYLPCNIWMPGEMSGGYNGETSVEERSTHFVITCREIYSNGMESDDQYEFQTYPSKDKENQFQFKPNHYYNIEIAIRELNPDDPFVQIVGYNKLPESNCYLLRRDTKDAYALPLTRINKFWENECGITVLDEDTEWVAEVIWQDSPTRLIDFASYRGFEAADDLSYLEGVGYHEEADTTSFAFRTTGSGEGNVIVGVRKKVDGWKDIPVEEREYLWSWHLWITDYAPDEFTDEGPYNWYYKEVRGGAIHRYPAIEYWETDGASQYIMDRDLGARKTFDETSVLDDMVPYIGGGEWDYRFNDVYPTFGLYYQYGRKDPFPYSEGAYPDNPKDDEEGIYPKEGIQMVYDINGNVIDAFSKHTTMILSKPNEGSFEEAVMHPYVFYTISPESRFWHNPEVGADEEVEAWLMPDWNDSVMDDLGTDKSFYDPCPPGWRVIPNITVYGSWSDATLQNRVHHYSESSSFNLGTVIELGGGHNAFYPASGRRDGVYGKIDYESDKDDESEIKHYFKFWTFSGLSEWWMASGDFDENNFDNGVSTNVFSLSNWNYTTGEPAGVGLPVRCIRDVP